MVSRDCPSEEQLEGFAVGEIPRSEIETVANHLKTCARCASEMETLDQRSDQLTVRLRRVTDEVQAPQDEEVSRVEQSAMQLTGEPAKQNPAEQEPVPVGAAAYRAIRPLGELLQRGDRLGEYMIEGIIDRGGMGVVYKASHKWAQIKTEFALKTILPQYMTDADTIDRFKRGAAAAMALRDDRIAHVDFAGEDRGRHFLVMEYVGGSDLTKILQRFGPLQIPDACEVIRQAALALDYAHQRGVFHRDVKPANIMLDRAVLKLTDFGLGKLREGSGKDRQREVEADDSPSPDPGTKAIMGTPDYMSPEQWTCTASVQAPADIYSLGCTFYQLLEGNAPFHKYADKKRAHISEKPAKIPLIQNRRWRRVREILDRMLAKDPAGRYVSALEVAEALRPLARGSDLGGVSNGTRKQVVPTDERTRGRDVFLPAAMALNLVLAVLLVYFVVATRSSNGNRHVPERRVLIAASRANSTVPKRLIVFDAGIGSFSEEFKTWSSPADASLQVQLMKVEAARIKYEQPRKGLLEVSYDYPRGGFTSAMFMIRRLRSSGDQRLYLRDYREGYIELRAAPVAPEPAANAPVGDFPSFGVELVRDDQPFIQVKLEFTPKFFNPETGWYEFLIPLGDALQDEPDELEQVLITFSDMYESGQTGVLYLDTIELVTN